MKRLLVILSVIVLSGFAAAANHDCQLPLNDGTATISGTVTDAVTGDPIEGAKVSAGRCCRGRYAYTNEDGEYTITELAAGEYNVKAMAEGYECETYPDPVTVEEGQQVTGIDLELAPTGGGGGDGSISGIVYDKETGVPVADAKVMAGTCRNGRVTYTNEEGEYALADLADGEYTVKASKKGYGCAVYPDPVVVENGGAAEGIDIYLTPRCQEALD